MNVVAKGQTILLNVYVLKFVNWPPHSASVGRPTQKPSSESEDGSSPTVHEEQLAHLDKGTCSMTLKTASVSEVGQGVEFLDEDRGDTLEVEDDVFRW